MWTVNAIAAGVTQQIRTRTRELGVRQCASSDKRYTLRSDLRGRLRQCVTLRVDVAQEDSAGIALEVLVHRIASGNAARNRECVGAGILHTQRVSADQRSGGNPTIQLENAAQLPSTQQRRGRSMQRLRHGHLPYGIDSRAMPDVKVRRRVTDVRSEPE